MTAVHKVPYGKVDVYKPISERIFKLRLTGTHLRVGMVEYKFVLYDDQLLYHWHVPPTGPTASVAFVFREKRTRLTAQLCFLMGLNMVLHQPEFIVLKSAPAYASFDVVSMLLN